jgi:hypothetical protein
MTYQVRTLVGVLAEVETLDMAQTIQAQLRADGVKSDVLDNEGAVVPEPDVYAFQAAKPLGGA